MNRIMFGIFLATAVTTTATVANAAGHARVPALATSAASDFNGAPEILRGDYVAAEHVLARQLRIWPGDADLLLNLAYVYRHTGRASEARTLYRAVLARPNEAVATQDRNDQSAHAMAQAALVTLDGTQLTAR